MYFSGYSCQSCAQRSDGLSAHPFARSRLRFPLFIPCFELQRVAAAAFGSLRKCFIASFLTSAQMSTSLACFLSLPFPYHPPSVLFSSWPSLSSCQKSGMRSWVGDLLALKKRVGPVFFSATCKDVHAQGLVLHHSIHVLTPQLQMKPPRSLSHSSSQQ